jgi:hypothetical protein
MPGALRDTFAVNNSLSMLGVTMWKLKTNVDITVRDLQGKIIDKKSIKNLITTVGLNMVRDLWEGLISDGEIKYVGVGSDNTAPAIGDTTLGTEVFRKAVTSFTEPADGQLKTTVYIAPAEAVGAIEEVGWFAGAAAGAGADSGILVSHILYSRNKTNLESIQIERTDEIAEA